MDYWIAGLMRHTNPQIAHSKHPQIQLAQDDGDARFFSRLNG
jgi:hypothetical protein